MKLSKLLLLLLSSVLRVQSSYNCRPAQELTSCGAFKIVKTRDHYKIRAQQCTSGNCAIDSVLITCSNICNFCDKVPALHIEQGCGRNKSLCEEKVDQFLIRSCRNTATIPLPPTQEVILQTHCINTQPVTTVTVSKITMERAPTNCTPIISTQKIVMVDTEIPASILGVLAGVFIVALTVVVAGWVCTCWTMKKKLNTTQLCTKCQNCEEKQSYPNPTYGTTTETQLTVGAATQHHSQEERNGQTHHTFNRGNDQGNFHDNKNHNQLDIQDNHTVNGTAGEGESGEEHMYYVLEKSGDDDYEDPDKDLEENTAMEYEIPVPLMS